MAAITKQEVKDYVLIQDSYAEDEAITFTSREWRRLSNKPAVEIIKVSTKSADYGSTNKWTSTNFYESTKDRAGYTLVKHSTVSTTTLSTAGVTRYFTYSYNEYDENIDRLIPQVEYDLCSYLNNYFEDPTIYLWRGSGLNFVKGTTAADYISDDDKDFSTAGFKDGMDIVVRGGSNAGMYTVSSASSATLRLTSTGALVSQDMDNTFNPMGGVKVSRIKWPQEIKPYLAQMIYYRLNRSKPDNIQSERIDDYSVTYINGNAYPTEILKGVAKWKKVVLV